MFTVQKQYHMGLLYYVSYALSYLTCLRPFVPCAPYLLALSAHLAHLFNVPYAPLNHFRMDL